MASRAGNTGGRLLAWVLGALAAVVAFAFFTVLGLLAGGGCGGSQTGSVGGPGIPARLIPVYEAAARRYGLGPQGPAVLAAINRIETEFGRNLSTSSAGALGWMQFEPGTWLTYGVDANHDGRKDPNNPLDAIFAAAHYLRASGAPRDWHAAVFAYNHAEWYVTDVLTHAQQYARGTSGASGASGAISADSAGLGGCGESLAVPGSYTFPIPAGVRVAWERIDMGQDMQAPYGTPLVAFGDGIVAYNPGGFPCSIVLRLTAGPYRGRSIYYGHSGPHRFKAGAHVRVGQVLTHAHGNDCGGESGHMELGWASGANAAAFRCAAETGGATCPHETAEGRSMHTLLQTLYQARGRGAGKL